MHRGLLKSALPFGATLAVVLSAVWIAGNWTYRANAKPSFSEVRANRRAYDGAPPVIPHPALGGTCVNCHAAVERIVPGVGIAPPNPHLRTLGMSDGSRCQQCHVFQTTDAEFTKNAFLGLPQNLRDGSRLYAHAPPVLPHALFMREDCASCHIGTTARPEIRCSHPERSNCLQCHARVAFVAR